MTIRPLVLGGDPGLSYGLLQPTPQLDALRQPKAPALNPPPPGMDPRARNAGLAEALSNTPRVEGNSWVEALAAALTGGLRGRAEIDQRQQELADHQRELDQQTRTQKVEDGRQASITDALTAYQSADPNDPQAQQAAVVRALSTGDPQDAIQMVQSDVGGRLTQGRQRDQYAWQRNFDNTNPEAITPYQRATLDNQRATSSGEGGRPPQGYRWTADHNLEAIPGGPAAMRVDAQAARAARSALDQLSAGQGVLRSINIARAQARQFGTTGMLGGALQNVPGFDAHNLQQTVQQIRANIGFDKLAQMRANSPTGGALGNVSDRETALLQSVLGSLEQSQSQEQFIQHLDDLQRTYSESMQRLREAYQQDYGQPLPEDQAPSSAAPSPAPQRPSNVPPGATWNGRMWVAPRQ